MNCREITIFYHRVQLISKISSTLASKVFLSVEFVASKAFTMEDECDYMSDEILKECVKLEPSKDPFLHKLKNKNVKKEKPRTQLESEKREEGLNTAITANNKGFKMLEKMGYKPGTGLGKSLLGRKEPVKLNLKLNSRGLGHENHILEKQQEKAAQISPNKFRSQLRNKMQIRYVHHDLFRSQKLCYEFDMKEKNLDKPLVEWYWPDVPQEQDDDQIEEKEKEKPTDSELSDRLEEITKYLRKTYNYCIWCWTRYEDEKDMLSTCPGETREDHE